MKLHYKHLHRWKCLPFEWGRSDCMMTVADYLLELTGIDPAQDYRVWSETAGKYMPIYDDMPSCHKVSGFLRDPVKTFGEGMAHIPLHRVETAQEGDVGIIHADGSGMGIAAIYLGQNWGAKGRDGLIIGTPQRVLAIWSVEPWRGALA